MKTFRKYFAWVLYVVAGVIAFMAGFTADTIKEFGIWLLPVGFFMIVGMACDPTFDITD